MSKPELTIMGGGLHNDRLAESTIRMADSAQWKRQRIVVIMPASDTMSTKVALSHMSLIFPPNNPVVRILATGMEVGAAYSSAIENVLAHEELSTWEYILTIEHDNVPPQDGVLKLIERMDAHPEMDCIGGLYWTKGAGGVPQIWGDVNDPIPNFRPQPPRPGELVECCGTGMGFNLFRLAMFKDERLRKPWFKTVAGLEGVGTQDLYAWGDFRKNGHRCAIDCAVLVGHFDSATGMTW